MKPMDSASASRNYQEFEPRLEWLDHPDSRVLIVHLLGFRSNQLKVQVTSTEKLRISGERRLGGGKWLRFHKEIDVPADTDTDNITAKLEEGILYVKQSKKSFAASSNNPPDQIPKRKAESRPTPAATAASKPKADPQPPATSKPPAAKPTVDPPTVRQNAPKSQNAQASGKQIPTPPKPQEPPKPKEAVAAADPMKLPADSPTVRQNAPKSQNEKPQSQAYGKQIPTPQMDRTEKQTEEKEKAHTKLKDALEKTKKEEGKEEIRSKMEEEKEKGKGKEKEEEGSHGREEKEDGVAEGRERRRRRKRSEEMVEESGKLRRGEGYKQVIDGMVKELRTNMVTLVLGVAVFVIVYLNVTKKGHVEEEL